MGRLVSRLSPLLQRRLSWEALGPSSSMRKPCSKGCYSLSHLLPSLSGSLTADFSSSGLIAAGRAHMEVTKAGASHAVTGRLSPKEVNRRLDFTPRLSKLQVAASLAAATIFCTAFHFWRAPQHMSPWHAIQVAALAAVVLSIARSLCLEASYQAQSAPVEALKSHSSRFLDFHGMQIHYTSASSPESRPEPASQGPRLVHAYHGFGANTASWAYADKGLADALAATFTAHDMPGFGLTQRSSKLADYTLEHNARIGRAVLDAGQPKGSPAPRRVLIGHSLGGVCAALEALRSPQDYEALVLVAPALMGGFGRVGQGNGRTGVLSRSTHALNAVFGSGQLPSTVPVPRRAAWHQSLLAGLRAFASWTATAALEVLLWLLRPGLVFALRSTVRNRAFWQRGLRSSWYRGEKLPEELLNGYRLPQLMQGWESGLLRFLTCRISGGRSTWSALKEVFTTSHSDKVLSTNTVRKLAALTSTHRLKVMIIHGKHDRLVPLKNSLRLAQQMPYIRLVVLPECGHSPQEEMPERFVSELRNFLEER